MRSYILVNFCYHLLAESKHGGGGAGGGESLIFFCGAGVGGGVELEGASQYLYLWEHLATQVNTLYFVWLDVQKNA